AQLLGVEDRLQRRVDAPVVAQPLNRIGRPPLREAGPNSPAHELPHVFGGEVPRPGYKRDRLAVAAVQGKAHVHLLPVPAVDLEGIRAPAHVRPVGLDPARVRSARSPAVLGWDLEAVHAHDSPDPLLVVALACPAQQHRHPPVTVAAPLPDHLPDLRQHGLVLSPPVEARPVLRLPVRRRPAHAQCTADGREWVSRHGPNTPYQLSLLLPAACAAWRLSTSMLSRPRARSSSRIRASASRSSRAGTTSSPAATAVFAPCSKSRFHLRTAEELTSNSRASPESVISPRRTRSTCSFLKAVVNSRRPSAPLRNSPILLLLEEVQHNLSQVSTPIGGRRTANRNLRAHLRKKGFRVGKNRVLRVMRENGLLAPVRRKNARGDPTHSGTIRTDRPDEMWGTDATRFWTEEDGWCWFFGAVDHC